jgi:TonB family protein
LGASVPSKGQVVMLRKYYCGNELKFDVQGKLVSGGQTGPWTLCRDIRIEQVKLENGKLRIEGWRAFLFYDFEQKQFRDIHEAKRDGDCSNQKSANQKSVGITIDLPSGANDHNIQSAMNLLFYSSPQEARADVPDEWKSYMEAEYKLRGQPAASLTSATGDASTSVDVKASSSSDDQDDPILRPGSGVTVPVPLHSPDPKYSEQGLCAHLTGTMAMDVVVGRDGQVRRAVISRALGLGLDESAVRNVLGWKFRPATKDGKPVSVEVRIDVTYCQYSDSKSACGSSPNNTDASIPSKEKPKSASGSSPGNTGASIPSKEQPKSASGSSPDNTGASIPSKEQPKSASGLSPENTGASIPSKGQLVMLRKYYCGNELKFDAQGKLLSGGQTGPWTLCRDIQIEHVKLKKGKLRVEGRRAFLFYDQEQKQFRDVYEAHLQACPQQKVGITIELPPGADDTNIQSAMNLLFYSSPQEALATTPDAWKPFMQAEYNRHGQSATSSGPLAGDASSAVDVKTSSTPSEDEDGKIQGIGPGVAAPVALHTPDPSYTDPARCSKLQGTVVLTVIIGRDGLVRRAVVVRALGLGLDENAIVTVLGWKFKPATKDGKPVPVKVNVEVSYNLY